MKGSWPGSSTSLREQANPEAARRLLVLLVGVQRMSHQPAGFSQHEPVIGLRSDLERRDRPVNSLIRLRTSRPAGVEIPAAEALPRFRDFIAQVAGILRIRVGL